MMPPIALQTAAAVARELVANPLVDVKQYQAPVVAEVVEKEVGARIEHLTNTENWWQSRVTLGSLTSVVGGALAIAAGIKAGSWDPEVYVMGLASMAGGGFALYGRWKATKPLGA